MNSQCGVRGNWYKSNTKAFISGYEVVQVTKNTTQKVTKNTTQKCCLHKAEFVQGNKTQEILLVSKIKANPTRPDLVIKNKKKQTC